MSAAPDLLDQLTEPEPVPSPASDRTITADLMARLERHYLPPQPMPGGVFVTEVGENGAWGASSRADALYVGFTSASGRLLVGHEVKASRNDWLAELRKPGKADAWADQCHEWWLVTVPGVVADGELPAGWGLMVPGRSTTRMKVLVPARRHAERRPSWDAVRSIMSRLDTLQRQRLEDVRRTALAEARTVAERNIDERVAAGLRNAGADVERLARYDRIIGSFANETDLAAVAELYRDKANLAEARRYLAGGYVRLNVGQLRRAADQYEQAVAAVFEAADDAEPTLEAGAA
jgi:hypothetical protein